MFGLTVNHFSVKPAAPPPPLPPALTAAVATLRMMAKDNVDAAVALDKVERLEDPECATEKVSKRVEVVFVNRLPERA